MPSMPNSRSGSRSNSREAGLDSYDHLVSWGAVAAVPPGPRFGRPSLLSHRDVSLFEGLTHHLERCSGILRQLIEKKYPVLGERNFARPRVGAAPAKCDLRYGVMGRAEWPARDDARVAVQ